MMHFDVYFTSDLFLANIKQIEQETKKLILLVQNVFFAHLNKIGSQHGNVMKFTRHIHRNMCWNNYLTFNRAGYFDF